MLDARSPDDLRLARYREMMQFFQGLDFFALAGAVVDEIQAADVELSFEEKELVGLAVMMAYNKIVGGAFASTMDLEIIDLIQGTG